MTIKQLLNKPSLPTVEKRILLSHVLGKDKSYLHAHDDEEISKSQIAKFQTLVDRREKGEPIQYLTNISYFYGLEFFVDNRVLIPREETEDMVDEALEFVSQKSDPRDLTIVDVGTGSGAIIISLAKKINNKNIKLLATDISSEALEVAKSNAEKNEVADKITFFGGNLLEALPKETKLDLILANLPYVRNHLYGVLDPQITWEPKVAILGGDDGMLYYNQLFNKLPNFLKKDGLVLYEIDGRIYRKALTD